MHITILGGGLTGLSAAHHISRAVPTAQITLIEASNRFGGWVQSTRQGVVLEGGPRSIRPGRSSAGAIMLKMIRDIGLESSIVPVPRDSPSARNRFFLKDGKLEPVGVRSALTPRTVFSVLTEPLDLFRPARSDESVDSFLTRKFGHSIAALASTGLHGIYAASSSDLSAEAILGSFYKAQSYRSVVLGLLWMKLFPSTASKRTTATAAAHWAQLGPLGKEAATWASYGLQGGLATLTDHLASSLRADLRLNEKVLSLTPGTVRTSRGLITTDHVIACIPPAELAKIASLPHLTVNPSTTVGVVNFVYPAPPSQIHPEAFGYLVPKHDPHGVLGVVFDSTALPGLDDHSVTKLTVMMGGPYWSTYGSSMPPNLVSPALEHLHGVLPALRSLTPTHAIPHLQRDCIPTYLPGHYARMRELGAALQPWHGTLSLAGAGYYGPSVNDCVASAAAIASALANGQHPTGLEWLNA
ncbi:hypothetical protein BD324DRAFT_647382 [Kockovaella imperatae]|uniref:Protoporphyrinogen oxidase n=1 Tax=Kockovaella imperatae TaxID=4999 RepID=A0A1Y1UR41_9TREE|nr:hypothetical protein BD324DRAFT_647382 [Kockovaella imperatae]ORX40449.1 hypothetical protein BD324DRAFT_647382 [Kockovaella imperatae]